MRKVIGLPSRASFPSILASFAHAIRALQSESRPEACASPLLLPDDRIAAPPTFSRTSLGLFTACSFLDARCDIASDICMEYSSSPNKRYCTMSGAAGVKKFAVFGSEAESEHIVCFPAVAIRCCGCPSPEFRPRYRKSLSSSKRSVAGRRSIFPGSPAQPRSAMQEVGSA